jgi:hypothetical protein
LREIHKVLPAEKLSRSATRANSTKEARGHWLRVRADRR